MHAKRLSCPLLNGKLVESGHIAHGLVRGLRELRSPQYSRVEEDEVPPLPGSRERVLTYIMAKQYLAEQPSSSPMSVHQVMLVCLPRLGPGECCPAVWDLNSGRGVVFFGSLSLPIVSRLLFVRSSLEAFWKMEEGCTATIPKGCGVIQYCTVLALYPTTRLGVIAVNL